MTQPDITNQMETQRTIETIVIFSEAYKNLRGRKRPTPERNQALDTLEGQINSLIQSIYTEDLKNG